MTVMNKDAVKAQNATIVANMAAALKDGDAEKAAEAFAEMQANIAAGIEAEFEQYKNTTDSAVLAARGVATLTSEETAFYQSLIKATAAGARQEITNLVNAMPITILDRTMDDMAKAHPLLSKFNFVDAAGQIKLIANAAQLSKKLGSWGAIASHITAQLTGEITVVDAAKKKYTAYFFIPKDFVKFNFGFAPAWVDRYVRAILSASIGYGLEKTLCYGDGKNEFLGMAMDTETATSGVHPKKTAVELTDWEDSYADVIATLAVDATGDTRNFSKVLLVVNPIDNIKKIRKVQNTITHAGIVDMISHTFPTEVVTSEVVEQGEAIVGLPEFYFAALNGGESGVVEYSDDYQFLDDIRTYTTRIYGEGMPLDNNAFALLDISNVEAPALPVKVKGTVKTKAEE